MWFSRFIPRKLTEFSTRYSKNVRVNDLSGEKTLLVGGSPQSGTYMREIWVKTLREFEIDSSFNVHSILMLGVGGGTLISLLHNLFPEAVITGIERDNKIIEIARKYFDLNKISGLNVVCADARDYVWQAVKKGQTYDLLAVDLSTGRHIPAFVSEDNFFTCLKKLMNPKSIVIFNYLWEREYNKKSDSLKIKLEKMFTSVRDYRIRRNRIFLLK